jgi:NADPH2:quinone reductase
MRAIRVNEFGGPEVLAIETVAEPEPGANQVLVDVRVAGVAYGDVIVRSGLFPVPLPWIPGGEVGGVVAGGGRASTSRCWAGRW